MRGHFRAEMKKYILALDQGTTGSRAILFDKDENIVAQAYKEVRRSFPRPGWVEQDPEELYAAQYGVMAEVMARSDVKVEDIAAIGIACQRETTIVWDKKTGKPVSPAIVWQCRRTADYCEKLKKDGLAEMIRFKTGLLPDAYFSATKLMWILDNVPGVRARAENGELLFGTVDSYLIWHLTKGAVHATDRTNASRTMLYNIKKLCWDKELLNMFNIPECMLPEVLPSSAQFGVCNSFGTPIPICGVAGDQQAALFGQGCFSSGQAKNTYGTGCFMLMHTGAFPVYSACGLLTTLAATDSSGVGYALEGSVFTAGAAIKWLRDELKIIEHAADTEALALSLSDNGGVYLVPAFTGLGAPYWDMFARGAFVGLTPGSGRAHFARAALEAMAYRTNDLLETMKKETGAELRELKADGGAINNKFLAQFQADILGVPVFRPAHTDLTALGAARLAGMQVGLFDMNAPERREGGSVFTPKMTPEERKKNLDGWKAAVNSVRTRRSAE